ncbi:MAG: MotA/TolQ/ExbB proton channel family protein, partial [Akkermansiaceae bacterium]
EKGSRTRKVQPGDRGEIKTVIGGGEAALSIDVTGGKALALASIESDPWDIFRKGGFWIWPILGIALFSAICGVIKFTQIIRIRTPEGDWVTRILAALRSGDQSEAEAIAGRAVHPVSGVVKQCLGYVKAGPDVVEEVLYEQLIGVQNKLQSWLPFIAVTAATAPLLGLLGTVSGMIRTFNIITVSGTGDAKPLAGGISEALVTTLFGLVVAIPALIIHALLSRRCQGIIQNTEKLGLTLVNGLRGERFKTQDAEDK